MDIFDQKTSCSSSLLGPSQKAFASAPGLKRSLSRRLSNSIAPPAIPPPTGIFSPTPRFGRGAGEKMFFTNVNTRSKVHQRAEVKIHQLERDDGLMVLLLAGGARGGSPLRCCWEELIS